MDTSNSIFASKVKAYASAFASYQPMSYHKVLIVTDVQWDFVFGDLGNTEAQTILPFVLDKIYEYVKNGWLIIFLRDTHGGNYLETNEGKHLPVVHCQEGTPGWQIVEGLEVPGAIYINKPNFGYLGWKEFMKDFLGFSVEFKEIELIGVMTGICVVSNAIILKMLYPEAKISVDSKCCACVTPESHKAALTTMAMCQIEIK